MTPLVLYLTTDVPLETNEDLANVLEAIDAAAFGVGFKIEHAELGGHEVTP